MPALLRSEAHADLPIIDVTEPQGQLLVSTEEHLLFCAGVGSGKTTIGGMWAAQEAMRYPGIGFIGANTHTQLVRVTLRAFLGVLSDWKIPYVFNRKPPASWGKSAFEKHENIVTLRIQGQIRQIICAQLTNYDMLRGIEIRWYWIDETRDTKRDAFDVLEGRKRDGPHDATRPGLVTTTPDGFNWLYDAWVSTGKLALPDRKLITATSYSNPWLPPGYIENLVKTYSKRLARQELLGQFVPMTMGQAYAEFNRATHIDDTFAPRPDQGLVWTLDFNVAPMCSCVLAYNYKINGPHCFDEIHIDNTARTRDATDEFISRFKDHRGTITVYGDRSGNNADTRGDLTDFDIVEKELRKVFGARVVMKVNYGAAPSLAPSIQDVNNMLLNSLGQARLKFNSRCEYTIRDLEQVAFKPGTREIDKGDISLTHHSDALRYYVTAEYPSLSRKATGLNPVGA